MATILPSSPASFASALQGSGSNIASLVSSGNFAASLASKGGGLSSLPTSLAGLAPSLPSLPNIPTGNPIGDAMSLASAVPTPPDSVKGVSAQAFGAITASFKPFIPGVPQDLKAIAEKNAATQAAGQAAVAAPAAAQADTPALKQLTSSMSSMVDTSALQSAANSGNISAAFKSMSGTMGGALPSVSSSLASVTGAATNSLSVPSSSLLPSSASILSSASTGTGLSALPGGLGSVSSIVNNGARGLASPPASLSGITSALKNSSTGALNGISSLTAGSSLTTSLSAGPSGISDAVNKLKSLSPSSLTSGLAAGNQGLAALASAGLPASAAAALEANINSLNSSGPQPIKMPTIATNTVDRSEITAQVNSQLGDPKIPAPNFTGTGPAAEAVAAQDKAAQSKNAYSSLKASLYNAERTQSKKIDDAQAAYVDARNTLPVGDPKIGQIRYQWEEEIIAMSELRAENRKKLEQARQELNLDYSGNLRLG